MQVGLGSSWRAMVPALAASTSGTLSSPFARGTVLVDSAGSARLLVQALANEQGIAAGLTICTVPTWQRALAKRAGVLELWERWRSPRLATAILESFQPVADEHPLLGHFLAVPGRSLSTATRLATLFRSYAEHAPDVWDAWMRDEAEPLPEHFAWQPPLARAAAKRLGLDHSTLVDRLCEVAGYSPTWLFGLDYIPTTAVGLLTAASPIAGWFVHELPQWINELQPCVLPAAPSQVDPPRIELHGSHGPLRQAEVLRDELTRCFEADPTLEPREVRIVCPRPHQWAPIIGAVFRQRTHHPGGALRVFATDPSASSNEVIAALAAALALLDGRATATEVINFLLMPAITTRWGFADHLDDLITLVDKAQVRWGLDAEHRTRQHVPAGGYNTWVSGIDALLTGITMGEAIGPRQVTGIEAARATDLPLLGSLSEVIGRVWTLGHHSQSPLTVPNWCALAIQAIVDLTGLPMSDRWMERQAIDAVEALSRAHDNVSTTLTRKDFRKLLINATAAHVRRPALGNGALHLVTPSEAKHVDAKLVVFIGLSDDPDASLPDAIPGLVPETRALHTHDLLCQARAAKRVLIVTRTRSERTGAKLAMPVIIRTLARRLGIDVPTLRQHAPQPFNASEFAPPGSFDAVGYAGANALGRHSSAAQEVRRREALTLPIVDPPAELSLDALAQALTDPLKVFVRSQVGIRWFSTVKLNDQLPLDLGGLDRWALTESFIAGRLNQVPPERLLDKAKQSQLLPPGKLGIAMAARAGEEAEAIVAKASAWMTPHPQTHRLCVDLCGTRLTGSVVLHSKTIVLSSASANDKPLLVPWLGLLMLASSGIRAQAVVIRHGHRGVRTTVLNQIDVDSARAQLQTYLRAYVVSQSRLLPAPFDPAFRLAKERYKGYFRRNEWMDPAPGDWPKWGYPGPLWALFYEDPTRQFFLDQPTTEDPDPTVSGFEGWSQALYGLLAQHGGAS